MCDVVRVYKCFVVFLCDPVVFLFDPVVFLCDPDALRT